MKTINIESQDKNYKKCNYCGEYYFRGHEDLHMEKHKRKAEKEQLGLI